MAHGWLLFARRRGAAQCPSASINVAQPCSAVGRSVAPFIVRLSDDAIIWPQPIIRRHHMTNCVLPPHPGFLYSTICVDLVLELRHYG